MTKPQEATSAIAPSTSIAFQRSLRGSLLLLLLISVASCDDDPSECRTYASAQVGVGFDYEYEAVWDHDQNTMRWDENRNADWWSGTMEYADESAFVEEGRLLGDSRLVHATVVAEIGGIRHEDDYRYDTDGRLVEISRNTQDVVASTEVTVFDAHAADGRVLHGIHNYSEEDNECNGRMIDIEYDDVARTRTESISEGLSDEGTPCGTRRVSREHFDADLIVIERSLWNDRDPMRAPDVTRMFENSRTARVCVD